MEQMKQKKFKGICVFAIYRALNSRVTDYCRSVKEIYEICNKVYELFLENFEGTDFKDLNEELSAVERFANNRTFRIEKGTNYFEVIEIDDEDII